MVQFPSVDCEKYIKKKVEKGGAYATVEQIFISDQPSRKGTIKVDTVGRGTAK